MTIVDRRGVIADATDAPIAGDPNPGLAIKAPCLCATTNNITLEGLQAIDGVAVAAGNRVLVWQQTDPKTNGIYNASSSGWVRTVDADSNDKFACGMLVAIDSGTVHARAVFQLTSPDPVSLDTSNIVFGFMFNLIVDQITELVATAEAAAEDAEAAAAAAAAAAAVLGNFRQFDTKTLAAAATIPVGVQALRTAGLLAVGDTGDGLYKKVAGDPGVPTSFQSADGAWWQLVLPVEPTIPRALPSAWAPIGIHPSIVRRGPGIGNVTLTHDPESYARRSNYREPAATSSIYVDGNAADDSGAGTAEDPVKTLTYAATTSTKSNIIVRSGVYVPPVMASTDTAHVSTGPVLKRFFFESGVRIAAPGPRLQDQTFTSHTGTVDKCTLTLTGGQTIQRVLRRDQFDPVADLPLPLFQFASLAALVSSSANGWYIETVSGNKVFYIRMDDPGDAPGATAGTKKLLLNALYNVSSDWTINGVKVLMKGPALFDGISITGSELSGIPAHLYIDGIRSQFSPLWGMQNNGGTSFVKNTAVHACFTDCFNWNRGPVNKGYVIEQNNRGTCAGDILTYGTGIGANRNGSSAHDDVNIARFNCFYEQNWGPQIADIANAAAGVSWNVGVVCGPTSEPQSIGFYHQDAGRSVYYENCYAYGNTTAVTSAGGPARQSACVWEGNIIGTITDYDPRTGL